MGAFLFISYIATLIPPHIQHLRSRSSPNLFLKMAQSNSVLIDVRTPAEFATGFLSSNTANAINIEYQLIDQLPSLLVERGLVLQKSDSITLYCRSGRRSNIALQTLKELGYSNVRDIGGLEEARAMLRKEESRELEGEDVIAAKLEDWTDDGKEKARKKAFGSLLAGLKELE